MRTGIAVLLAVASALAFAVASVGQQRAAARTSDQDARDGRFFLQLLRDPKWLAATGGNAVGYVLQGAALGVGSVVVVQPILVTALLFALPLSARLSHERVPANVVLSGLLLTASLSVFEVLGNTSKGVSHGGYQGWLIVAAIGVPIVAGCLILARARHGAVRAAMLAIAVGLLGGVLAVLTKSVVDAGAGGLGQLVGAGETYGLIVVGVAGIYLQQLAFQAGALRTSLPIMTVLEPLVAAVLGLTLLHEHVQSGGLRLSAVLLSAALATAATVALARAQAGAPTS
ncbi:DMT family transporter [uncultured Jatrophihabitans sp.]|uniref:DMT family transporter n=1 Tax=uncultured Jatrophihabitans sp. TaxID=1610747 RepID=UPI0035C9EAB7